MNKQELQEELKKSMMARDSIRTSVLRLLLSAINYYEIQKGMPRRQPRVYRVETGVKAGGAGYEANEEDVLVVLNKEAKQRRDSIEEFKKAGRQELVDKETIELNILQSFLPEQMPEDEVRSIVEQTISEVSANSIQDMGKVMGALTGKLKGQADMGLVSQIVRTKLTS